MKLAFNRSTILKFKHNHVVLVATDEEEEELKHELLVTGLAIDVKHYECKQNRNLDSEPDGSNMVKDGMTYHA